MHRLVAICLLLLVPLQWSWAAPGAGARADCCLTVPVAGNDSNHCATTQADTPIAADAGDLRASDCGPDCRGDCTHCHAPSLNALLGLPATFLSFRGEARGGECASRVDNPIPDRLLRPPLPNPA